MAIIKKLEEQEGEKDVKMPLKKQSLALQVDTHFEIAVGLFKAFSTLERVK